MSDVVTLDNPSGHKSETAQRATLSKCAWVLLPPPCNPDLNLIEIALSKLKARLRAAALPRDRCPQGAMHFANQIAGVLPNSSENQ